MLIIAALLTLYACTPEKHYRALHNFIDGIPDPGLTALNNKKDSATVKLSTKAFTAKKPDIILHKPYADGQCNSCHTSGINTTNDAALCFSCHEDFTKKLNYVHGPATGYCTGCHNPHKSNLAKLIKIPGQELCLNCHEIKSLAQTETHAEIGTANCTECHNPHGGNERYMFGDVKITATVNIEKTNKINLNQDTSKLVAKATESKNTDIFNSNIDIFSLPKSKQYMDTIKPKSNGLKNGNGNGNGNSHTEIIGETPAKNENSENTNSKIVNLNSDIKNVNAQQVNHVDINKKNTETIITDRNTIANDKNNNKANVIAENTNTLKNNNSQSENNTGIDKAIDNIVKTDQKVTKKNEHSSLANQEDNKTFSTSKTQTKETLKSENNKGINEDYNKSGSNNIKVQKADEAELQAKFEAEEKAYKEEMKKITAELSKQSEAEEEIKRVQAAEVKMKAENKKEIDLKYKAEYKMSKQQEDAFADSIFTSIFRELQQEARLDSILESKLPKNQINEFKVVKSLELTIDFNKTVLISGKEAELIYIIEFLKNYPERKVEVQGHTDNKGTEEYNKELSLKRAEYVKEFLIKNGIKADQISTIGHGFTRPKDTNDTEEGRAKNRRIEFRLIQ